MPSPSSGYQMAPTVKAVDMIAWPADFSEHKIATLKAGIEHVLANSSLFEIATALEEVYDAAVSECVANEHNG